MRTITDEISKTDIKKVMMLLAEGRTIKAVQKIKDSTGASLVLSVAIKDQIVTAMVLLKLLGKRDDCVLKAI